MRIRPCSHRNRVFLLIQKFFNGAHALVDPGVFGQNGFGFCVGHGDFVVPVALPAGGGLVVCNEFQIFVLEAMAPEELVAIDLWCVLRQ